jgi:hypothetical protein
MKQQRIQRQKVRRRSPESETAGDFERAERVRQRARKTSREAEAFLDHTVWGGRP